MTTVHLERGVKVPLVPFQLTFEGKYATFVSQNKEETAQVTVLETWSASLQSHWSSVGFADPHLKLIGFGEIKPNGQLKVIGIALKYTVDAIQNTVKSKKRISVPKMWAIIAVLVLSSMLLFASVAKLTRECNLKLCLGWPEVVTGTDPALKALSNRLAAPFAHSGRQKQIQWDEKLETVEKPSANKEQEPSQSNKNLNVASPQGSCGVCSVEQYAKIDIPAAIALRDSLLAHSAVTSAFEDAWAQLNDDEETEDSDNN